MSDENTVTESTSDLVSYVERKKNTSFSELPFNSADGLVLAVLAYIDWGKAGIDYLGDGSKTLKEAIECLIQAGGNAWGTDERELLIAISESERFGNMKISNYAEARKKKADAQVYEELEQFAAVTFTYTDGEGKIKNYVSCRGTDGTLEGWCEDFNMAYDTMTEAQKESVAYLNQIAKMLDGEIQIGGHSKGGNHALYAFLFCEESVRQRVDKLYNFDGPGFIEGINYVDDQGNVISLDPKVYQRMNELFDGSAICPYNSIIGQLLNENKFLFVDSIRDDIVSHSAYTWRLDPDTGMFILKEQTSLSKSINSVLDNWMTFVPQGYRKTFMTAIWNWLYSMGGESFDDVGTALKIDWKKSTLSVLSYLRELPEDQKNAFLGGLTFLGFCALDDYLQKSNSGYNTIRENLKQELQTKGINTTEKMWLYLKEDPINNTWDIIETMLTNRDSLGVAMASIGTGVLGMQVLKVCIATLDYAVDFVYGNLKIFAMIQSAVVTAVSGAAVMKAHWQAIQEFANSSEEYKQEHIHDWVNQIKTETSNYVHEVLNRCSFKMQQMAERICAAKTHVQNVIVQLSDLSAAYIPKALKLSNPFLYCSMRAFGNCRQSAVTIDMNRLRNAVDQMERLSVRVGQVDEHLNILYRKLSISNIQQGENVWTSLVNMYHLSVSDICVDEGSRIKCQAKAISELFDEYKEAEKWVMAQIGG